ncbi:MAG: Hypoxanthine phosphoribosyltransferase, partial [Acidobacteria bacterium]|nr:Hypoxanthine phosphoribosyltransferase [Acidobacteriota bacterium]
MEVEQVFSEEAIAERVRALGAAIRQEMGEGEVFLLCILKGASFLLADLMRSISGPVGYGFIDVIRD